MCLYRCASIGPFITHPLQYHQSRNVFLATRKNGQILDQDFLIVFFFILFSIFWTVTYYRVGHHVESEAKWKQLWKATNAQESYSRQFPSLFMRAHSLFWYVTCKAGEQPTLRKRRTLRYRPHENSVFFLSWVNLSPLKNTWWEIDSTSYGAWRRLCMVRCLQSIRLHHQLVGG